MRAGRFDNFTKGDNVPIITKKSTDLSVTELANLLRAELVPAEEESKVDRALALAERVLNDQAPLDTAS